MRSLSADLPHRLRRRAAAAVAGLVVFVSPAAGGAARRVASVEVSGARSLSERSVLHYLRLEPGEELDEWALAELNAGLHALWSSGLVDDVVVETVERAEGVEVRVRIEERPRLLEVSYEGLAPLQRSEAEARIAGESLALAVGEPLRRDQVEHVRRTLLGWYRERGFPFARVDVDCADDAELPSSCRLRVRVRPGRRLRIEEVRFEGNRAFDDERLRRAMKHTRETGILSRMLQRDVLAPGGLEEDLETVSQLYRRAGFEEVRLGEPEIVAAEGSVRASVSISVEEGPRSRLAGIFVEGNSVFGDSQLLRAFGGARDHWLDFTAVDRALDEIRARYQERGYLQAVVEARTRAAAERRVHLVVTVREGQQYRLARLEFGGNEKTLDRVLRREIAAREGEVLRLRSLQRSLLRIEQLGYFQLDRDRPIDLRLDEEAGSAELVVRGSEADRTRIDAGGSWNPGAGDLQGRLSLATHNLFGRGMSLGLSAVGGGLTDSFDLTWAAPWVRDRPQQIGARVFRRQRLFDGAAGERTRQEEEGTVLSFTRRSVEMGRGAGFGSLDLLLAHRQTRQTRVGEALDLAAAGPRDSTSLSLVYRYDSRDDRLDPRSGTQLRAALEYGGGPLGGDRSFIRSELGARHLRPVGSRPSMTLGLRVESGFVGPSRGQSLFPLDGYFLGGPDSVRGFRESSIWTRDADGELVYEDGFQRGGNGFLETSVELQFQLVRPLRLVLFGDAGNVIGRSQSFDLGDLRTSVGAELRLSLPRLGVPLRLIYAYNPNPLPGDRFDSLRLSFGASF